MQPKVSILVPVYNVEAYLEQCLDSIMNQTLKEIEIICINDGSTDNSLAILKEYAEKDARIILVDKENGGLSSARNAGIPVASGKYIYFLDSDDYILENTLECLYNEMEENHLDSILFDADSFYESEELEKKHASYKESYHRPDIYEDVVTGMQLIETMTKDGQYKPSACLQMNRTSILTENGILFKEGIIHEDNLFTVQVSMHARRAKHIAKAFYQRRVRGESIMTERTALNSAYGYMISLEETLREILNSGAEDVRKAYVPQLSRMRNAAAGALKKLSQEELENIEIEGSFEQKILFDFVIKDYAKIAQKKDKRIRELKRQVKKLEAEKEALDKELAEIKGSKAYKLRNIFKK